MNLPTIVTCFYDIRGKYQTETNGNGNVKNKNTYFDLANEFILKLPYPLIIYTDEHELLSYIIEKRQKYLNLTKIIFIPFETTYYYQYMNQLYDNKQKFQILNENIHKDTVPYMILNYNKFFFIERTIELNPFLSTHFVWIDFGINHVAKNTEEIHNWITNIPDKIKQICINPYLETQNYKQFFNIIYHHTAGGLFSGSSGNLLLYSLYFRQKVQQILNDDWYQIDETIMTIIQREHPELFTFYYGDYEGIISNYITPKHNINLICRMIDKSVSYLRNDVCYQILQYVIPFYKLKINQNHHFFYHFLHKHIIIDYDYNDKCLLLSIVNILNEQIINENERIIQLCRNTHDLLTRYRNIHNLLHYLPDSENSS
jgi:hypothetical protein